MSKMADDEKPLRSTDLLQRLGANNSIAAVTVRVNGILSSYHRRFAPATDPDPESLVSLQKGSNTYFETCDEEGSGKYRKRFSLGRNRATLLLLGLVFAALLFFAKIWTTPDLGRDEALLRISPDDWRQCTDNQRVIPRLAIIRPYVKRQIPKLSKWIRKWGEKNLRPCDEQVAADLIFWYNRDLDKEPEARERVQAALESVPQARACFGNVYFMSANLTDEQDVYYFSDRERRYVSPGTTFMFYPLFGKKDLVEKYGYFFYMEPDTVPIRAKWLHALYSESIGADNKFWVKGTDPAYYVKRRSYYWSYEVEKKHINGNAIYRLGNDCFNRLLKRVEYEYTDNPFDMAMYNYRIHKAHSNEMKVYGHLFAYSPIIRNYGHFPYSLSKARQNPKTFLVHGVNQRA